MCPASIGEARIEVLLPQFDALVKEDFTAASTCAFRVKWALCCAEDCWDTGLGKSRRYSENNFMTTFSSDEVSRVHIWPGLLHPLSALEEQAGTRPRPQLVLEPRKEKRSDYRFVFWKQKWPPGLLYRVFWAGGATLRGLLQIDEPSYDLTLPD